MDDRESDVSYHHGLTISLALILMFIFTVDIYNKFDDIMSYILIFLQ